MNDSGFDDAPLVWLSCLGVARVEQLEASVFGQAADVSRRENGVLWYEVVVAAESGEHERPLYRVTVVAHLAADEIAVSYEDHLLADSVPRAFAMLARRLAARRKPDAEHQAESEASVPGPPVPSCDACSATEDLLVLPTLAIGDDLPGILLCRRCCSELPILEALAEF